ncbi:MAG TPA: hypothetical protein VNM66_05120, partial [Thermodesulfobacteriota bacterium]|nr:hypothetical protein [Thermodesulfobacteriota bacterium]
ASRRLRELAARRQRILRVVRAAPDGISSVEVARKMGVDARGVGKILAALARSGAVRKEGALYRSA